MKEEFQNILIEKHLRGIANKVEEAELQAWRGGNAKNQQYFKEVQSLYKAMQSMDFDLQADTDSEWQKLQRQIGHSEAKVVAMKPRFNYLRIAAMFAVLIATGWLIQMQFLAGNANAVEYVVTKGKTEIIKLSDGTKVHLNADSKLMVLTDFNETERRVKLTGEAFFEVAKNKNIPFLIETGDVTTRVVGTAFNLTAYPDNRMVAINVTEGIVEFADADEKVLLTANKAANFDGDSGKIMEVPFQQSELAWQQGGLIFKNESFFLIMKDLERKFDVKIEDESGSEKRMLTEEIEANEKVEDVLNRIALTANLTLIKKDNVYTFVKK
ncbi:MAG: transmembrane sensor [Paraglaciecola sp.]|jgi:transmembrane sensor